MAISPQVLLDFQSTHRNDDVSYRLAQVIQTQSEIASAGLSLADVMSVVTTRSQSLMGAAGAVVEMVEQDEMVYRAASGSAEGYLGLRAPRTGSLSGLCVDTAKVLICNDSELDPRVDREACRRVGLRSMVVVPLSYGGTALGVLKVMDSRPEAYSSEEATVLQLMAGMIAASMAHARAYESSESQATQFAYLATHDSLTGLANRALVFDRLRYLFGQDKRHGDGVGVVVLDVNRFKPINDTCGHQAGDEALRWIGKRLATAGREVDLPARLGGDEFMVVLAPPIDREGMNRVVSRLVEQTRGCFDFEGHHIEISTSVGAALASESVCEPETLLRAAYQTMYEDKQRSRPSVAS